MAAPVIPILKKIAITLVTDKKGRKWLVGIICGVLFLCLMPMIAVLGVYSSGMDLNTDGVFDALYAQQAQMEVVAQEIGVQMIDAGYTYEQIEKAHALYMFALQNEGKSSGFVKRLIGCFELEEQTDEELIHAVNTEFGKSIRTEEFQNTLQEFWNRPRIE